MADSFKPSEVLLVVPPLTGTMKRSEIEQAACLVVRACRMLGDRWQPLTIEQIAEVIDQDLRDGNEPAVSLNRNPFFRPSLQGLADGPFGRWVVYGGGGHSVIELTPEGIEALRRWVIPASAAPAVRLTE